MLEMPQRVHALAVKSHHAIPLLVKPGNLSVHSLRRPIGKHPIERMPTEPHGKVRMKLQVGFNELLRICIPTLRVRGNGRLSCNEDTQEKEERSESGTRLHIKPHGVCVKYRLLEHARGTEEFPSFHASRRNIWLPGNPGESG